MATEPPIVGRIIAVSPSCAAARFSDSQMPLWRWKAWTVVEIFLIGLTKWHRIESGGLRFIYVPDWLSGWWDRCLPFEGTFTEPQRFLRNLLALIEQDDPAKGEVVCSKGIFLFGLAVPTTTFSLWSYQMVGEGRNGFGLASTGLLAYCSKYQEMPDPLSITCSHSNCVELWNDQLFMWEAQQVRVAFL